MEGDQIDELDSRDACFVLVESLTWYGSSLRCIFLGLKAKCLVPSII